MVSYYLIRPNWSRVHLEMKMDVQIAKKLDPFYGTGRFITVLTKARHWAIS